MSNPPTGNISTDRSDYVTGDTINWSATGLAQGLSYITGVLIGGTVFYVGYWVATSPSKTGTYSVGSNIIGPNDSFVLATYPGIFVVAQVPISVRQAPSTSSTQGPNYPPGTLTQTIQILSESEKGPDFSGSASVNVVGSLLGASLNVVSDSSIVTLQFNNLIVTPNENNWTADVSNYVQVGTNNLNVKVDYTPIDQFLGDVKNVHANLTIYYTGVNLSLSFASIGDFFSKISMDINSLGGTATYIIYAIIIIAVIVAVAVLITSVYGHQVLPTK